MNSKIKIHIGQNSLEVEGSESFIAKHYEDFKTLIIQNSSGDSTRTMDDKITQSTPKSTSQSTRSQSTRKKSKTKRTRKSSSVEFKRFNIDGGAKNPSLEKYFKDKNPSARAGDRIAVIGYFITKLLKEENFSEGHINFAYKMLKLKPLSDLNQILTKEKRKNNYFERTEESDSWKLTTMGEVFVEEDLSGKDK